MRASLLLLAACGHAPPPRCELPANPTTVVRDGPAFLLRWDVPDAPVWTSENLPDDPKYASYRKTIRDAGAELARPIADAPVATTDEQREVWRREGLNAELVYAGGAGEVRPVHCLEAALFAYQHARHDELVDPTEFSTLVLRKGGTLRVYFGAADVMFPPKTVYGIEQARRDVAAGWKLVAHLHDHTIQKRGERPALGTPMPSTADVQLLRGVTEDLGLERVWVTNGVFTYDGPTSALAKFHTREPE